MPGDGRETFVDPGEKLPFVLLRDETAEKGLVVGISQLAQQLLHERSHRRIFLQGMIRIIRHIGDQWSGQTALLKNVVPTQQLFAQALRAIGKERLQQFELVIFLPRQNRDTARPVNPEP
ncbi:hypothetical protein D3C71_1138670 [compost metagenome]